MKRRHTDFINGLRPLKHRHTDLADLNGSHGLIYSYILELGLFDRQEEYLISRCLQVSTKKSVTSVKIR